MGSLDLCLKVVEQRAVHQEAVRVTQRRLCADALPSVLLRQYSQRMDAVVARDALHAGVVADKVAAGIKDAPLRNQLLSVLALSVEWTTGTTSISSESVATWLAADLASATSEALLPGYSWGWTPESFTRLLVDVACFAGEVEPRTQNLDTLTSFTVTALSCLVDVGGAVGTRCLRRMLACGFFSHILKDVKKMGAWLTRIVRPRLVKEVRCCCLPWLGVAPRCGWDLVGLGAPKSAFVIR